MYQLQTVPAWTLELKAFVRQSRAISLPFQPRSGSGNLIA